MNSSTNKNDISDRIATLSVLYEKGFIDKYEYKMRKKAILKDPILISETYTRNETEFIPEDNKILDPVGYPAIVEHKPDFSFIKEEIAIQHDFIYDTLQWKCKKIYIKLDDIPFAKGSLRLVYYLNILKSDHIDSNNNTLYIAKRAINIKEDPQTYFRDIELQAHCRYYAKIYNTYNPPKKVKFIKASILELIERDHSLRAIEKFIPGDYKKHNNNFGCVSEDERNTPQAFSHFTYEASNHKLLAVDIQGVGDLYTDPQIHTTNGNDFGKGNLGPFGFQKFLSSHRCNPICRYFKLPSVNDKNNKKEEAGTVPIQKLMEIDKIQPMQFVSKHYYEKAPLLKKYIDSCKKNETNTSSHYNNVSKKLEHKTKKDNKKLEKLNHLNACMTTCSCLLM